MFKNIFFEISDFCNAKCPWCVTANTQMSQHKNRNFVTLDRFCQTLDILSHQEFLGDGSMLHLYNWGEPLLHRDISKIFQVLCERDIWFGISTNASQISNLDNLAQNDARKLGYLTISMPGFSQNSYDKIHGFNYVKILNNIDSLINRLRICGFSRKIILSYHVYQFNIQEISSAHDFCKERNIEFNPSCAYFNDYYLAVSYLKKNMDYKDMDRASKELLLFYVDELIKNKPEKYDCPQWSYLNIDPACNILTCCVVPPTHKDYSVGSVFNLSKDDILEKKLNQKICKECLETGVALWGHNPHRWPIDSKYLEEKLRKRSIVSNLICKCEFIGKKLKI